MRCERDDNYRDVFWKSDCDAAVRKLSSQLGWEAELDAVLAGVRAVPTSDAWHTGNISGQFRELRCFPPLCFRKLCNRC